MNILFILILSTAPLPLIETINLDLKDAGTVERVKTGINILTTVTPGGETVFPDKEKQALVTTLKSCCSFPDKLSISLLQKQLVNRKLRYLVVLTSKGIFILTTNRNYGPYALPTQRQSLPSQVIKILSGVKTEKPKTSTEKPPWWKNWMFWTGAVVITASIIVFSIASQSDDSIDVYLKHTP
ncbi:hypothetical protein KKF34_10915 [Myxococcota bacterium]|nr:hypothetical protein [Myxococcota bacterium]MBU1382799.1 hypothetical protein [Myxococcota bacterium]MBU1497378.1 hypothetical protein [Myxococcota bacterium]